MTCPVGHITPQCVCSPQLHQLWSRYRRKPALWASLPGIMYEGGDIIGLWELIIHWQEVRSHPLDLPSPGLSLALLFCPLFLSFPSLTLALLLTSRLLLSSQDFCSPSLSHLSCLLSLSPLSTPASLSLCTPNLCVCLSLSVCWWWLMST